MPEIKIKVENKIAQTIDPNAFIVCGNSDYIVNFSFDEEWAKEPVKTAVFVYAGYSVEKPFNGNICEVPILENTTQVKIGVFAGNLKTTTSAYVPCRKSIMDEGGKIPPKPTEEVYNEIITIVNEVAGEIPELGASIDLSVDSDYILTVTLKNQDGEKLSEKSVDLPIESLVVSALYDNEQKAIVFTLQNGERLIVPVGDLVQGFVKEEDFVKLEQIVEEKQGKMDESLNTESKEIVGAINEVKSVAEEARMIFGETEGTAYEGNKGKKNADDIVALGLKVDLLEQNIFQSGLGSIIPLTETFITRQTANGQNILDPSPAIVKKIKGKTVKANINTDLPAEYQEVEYIESTGKQYIDTGLNPALTQKIIIDGQFSDISGSQHNGATAPGFWFMILSIWEHYKYFGFQCGSSPVLSTVVKDLNRHIFTFDILNRKVGVDANEQFFTPSDISQVADVNITIFKLNGYAGYNKLKLYACKIYDSGTLVRNFIPCYRKSDNVIGLYDLVNKVFYTNKGKGTFLKGADCAVLKHAHFEKIVSTSADGAQSNEFALSAPVELPEWDYIYPQTGEIVRGTNVITLTGNENFAGGATGTTGWGGTDTVGFYTYFKKNTPQYEITIQQPNAIEERATWICNKFVCRETVYNTNSDGFMANGSYLGFRVKRSLLANYGSDNSSYSVNVTAFKAWLADMYAKGDPVIVAYEVMDEFKTTETLDCPKQYTAHNGGSETVVQGTTDNSKFGAISEIENEYWIVKEI